MGEFAPIGRSLQAADVGWSRVRSNAPTVTPLAPRTEGGGGSESDRGGGEPTRWPLVNSAYRAGSFDRQDTAEWAPTFGSADSDLLPARDIVTSRIRDVVRNDPTARSAVERLVDMIVGDGLRYSSKPDADALGITPEEARTLARKMQAEWKAFACTHDPHRWCDSQRRLSIDGLFRLGVRSMVIAGEICAAVDWRPGDHRYSTCIQAIDPDRVSNPYGMIEGPNLRGGVVMDDRGTPIGYHVREAHVGDWFSYGRAWTWSYVPRFTDWGRPVFIHAFEPEREGQTKAISPFTALINRLRMIGKFADTELASATANALFTAFVYTDMNPEEIKDRLTPGEDIRDHKSYASFLMRYYEKYPARVGGTRIPTMLPGSEIKMNASPRQTTAFPAFQTAFLHSIAAALNISYEQLTMDWSRVNYSSARAALNEVWRSTKRIRRVFSEQYVAPIAYAVMEEAFESGYIKAPKGAPEFQENPGAYLGGRWIGPGRGVVDALKEAEAASMRMENMTSTLEIECAENGHDYQDIMEQIAFEEAELKRLGLSRQSLIASVKSSRGPKPDSEEVVNSKEQDGGASEQTAEAA